MGYPSSERFVLADEIPPIAEAMGEGTSPAPICGGAALVPGGVIGEPARPSTMLRATRFAPAGGGEAPDGPELKFAPIYPSRDRLALSTVL